jgi:hypothetical protein
LRKSRAPILALVRCSAADGAFVGDDDGDDIARKLTVE